MPDHKPNFGSGPTKAEFWHPGFDRSSTLFNGNPSTYKGRSEPFNFRLYARIPNIVLRNNYAYGRPKERPSGDFDRPFCLSEYSNKLGAIRCCLHIVRDKYDGYG